MSWRRFWIAMVAAVAGGVTLAGVAVALIDPFANFGLLPDIERQPMSRDKRLAVPGLARQDRFDSVIVGTSTARLLRPSFLGPALDASFVNLSLDGSLPAEHARSLGYFLKFHPRPKALIVVVDPGMWCTEALQPQLRPRPMLDALYDDNRWNDLLHVLNWQMLRQAGEELLFLLGASELKWGMDGYTPGPQSQRYDPERAERLIYPLGRGASLDNPIAPRGKLGPDPDRWPFPTVETWLAPMLDRAPAETLKILMLPPAHRVALSPPGSPADLRFEACKRRIARIAACRPGTHLVDFAFESDITRHDGNFWDTTHVTLEVGERVQALLVEAVRTRRGRDDLYRYVDLSAVGADAAACRRAP